MRTSRTLAAAAGLTLAMSLSATALADNHVTSYTASLGQLNGSGASGTANVSLDGNQLTVQIEATGLAPGAPHAQHLHLGGQNICPDDSADENGDGLIETPEGVPFYGGIAASLTTEGDVTMESGLAVDRFPVADDSGNVSYSRTFELPSGLTADNVGDAVVVLHGVDLNDSGTYDGDQMSQLDPSLPLEATIPAACGALQGMDMPRTDTVSETGTSPALPLAIVTAALFGAAVAARRLGTAPTQR